MILLNGLVLNPSLQWEERFSSSDVLQSVKQTLGGRTVINAAQISGGRNITLVASEDTGWLTFAMVKALRVMAEVPGLILPFTFHNDLLGAQVAFRHHDKPALEVSALSPRAVHDDSDFFIGRIKLITVF